MPTYKCYDWQCKDCEYKEEVFVDTSVLDWDSPRACLECGTGEMHRVPSSPTVQKASFVDGTKRKGVADLKEAARLEVAKVAMPLSQRGDIEKEIKNLKRVKR